MNTNSQTVVVSAAFSGRLTLDVSVRDPKRSLGHHQLGGIWNQTLHYWSRVHMLYVPVCVCVCIHIYVHTCLFSPCVVASWGREVWPRPGWGGPRPYAAPRRHYTSVRHEHTEIWPGEPPEGAGVIQVIIKDINPLLK